MGEWVLAVGSPFGIEQTVTAGIISAKGRQLPGSEDDLYQEYIQTDAAINPGNSGGPLINLEGKVVGINTAIVGRAGQSAGLGFAIPSLLTQRAAESIINGGRVTRAYLGVNMRDLRPEERRELGLAPDVGVRLNSVVAGSPAEDAGLAAGDIVLRVNGREVIGGQNRLRNLIALNEPGSAFRVLAQRGEETLELRGTLGDLAVARMNAVAKEQNGEVLPGLGIVIAPMTRSLGRQLGYLRPIDGDAVVYMLPDSVAGESGLRVGDIITDRLDVNREGGGRLVRLDVVRGGDRGYVEVELD